MGLLCGKLRCCCCCCDCRKAMPAAAGIAMSTKSLHHYKVLLLGASGSGKTQLGHLLSGQERDANDLGPTNGVRCYRTAQSSANVQQMQLALTEVGGSADMQRLWPHYYATTHALIYCFDLSGGYNGIQAAFDLLERCLAHSALRGKPVLLVATRHCEGVQLYDVEHEFGLEALARRHDSPLHLCHFADVLDEQDVWRGVDWLRRQLLLYAPVLALRIRYDMNMQSWQQRKRSLLSSSKLAQVHRHRFRRQHRKLWPMPCNVLARTTRTRPCTAPATVFGISSSQQQQATSSS